MGAEGNYIVEEDVDNWASQVATISGTGIAFVASTRTITDSGNGFVTAGLQPNMRILVSGSTDNDGSYTADSVVAGTVTLISTDTLTDEAAGASVTIKSGERLETIERVENLIESITHDYFYSKSFVTYRNGNGKDQLFLGFIPDILTVTEILVSGTELTTSWWTYNTNSVYLDPEAVTAEEGDMAELHLRLKYERILFPKGVGNIKITGTYGWSSCPAIIKRAVVILCRYENDNTLYHFSDDDMKSERLGDYAYTRKDGGTAYFTGIVEVDRLLRGYIRKKPMLSAS